MYYIISILIMAWDANNSNPKKNTRIVSSKLSPLNPFIFHKENKTKVINQPSLKVKPPNYLHLSVQICYNNLIIFHPSLKNADNVILSIINAIYWGVSKKS